MTDHPDRIRSRAHLAFIRHLRCAVCRAGGPSHPHHLMIAQPKAKGLKAGDQWTVPLCPRHHDELHRAGDERAWWASLGIDPILLADQLWTLSPAKP